MERVVTINLNGNSYQLDEPAYDALRAYLARAEAALADNPDKAEIIRDLEQAVADKCAPYLGAHKSVVAADEMGRVLQEMGPVEGDGDAESQAPREAYDTPRKRLYRIKDGAHISGVCAGIGAYFDIDANIVRLLFVVATLFTSGFVILVYIAMMFLVPSAHTSEEWAAAHGVPFNAQEVIDRAKREASRVAAEANNWRRERRARRQWREHDGQWGGRGAYRGAAPEPAGYATRMVAGFFAFVLSIITAALLIAFLAVLVSLLGAGSVLGWAPPAGLPIWLAIVVIAIVYAAVSFPLAAMRRSSYATLSGNRGGGDGFITLILVALALGFAWLFWDEARLMMEHAYIFLRDGLTGGAAFWFWN